MTTLGRKSLLALGGDVATAIFSLVSTYFIARELGADILGALGYFLGFLGTLALVSDLGLHQAFRKRASEDPGETGAYILAFLGLKGLLSAVLVVAFGLAPLAEPRLAEWLTSSEAWWAYWYIAGFYVANSLLAVPILSFAARRETARMVLVTVGSNAVSSAAKIVVALGHLGMAALAAAYALQAIIGMVFGYAILRHLVLRRPTRRHVLRLLDYASPVLLVTCLAYIAQNVDRVLLERWAGARHVGYYAAVTGLLALMQRVPLAAVTLFFPQASEDARRGDLGEVNRRLRVIERYGLMVTVPMAAAVIGVSDLIVQLYLGQGFAPSAAVLATLAVNPVLLALFEPYNSVVYAVERHGRLVVVSLLGVITMVVADLLLIPTELGGHRLAGLGAVGAAIGGVVAQLVTGACQVVIASQATGVQIYWRGVRHLLAGTVMLLTVVLVRTILPSGIMTAIGAVVAGVATFCAMLLLSRELAASDLRRLRDLLNPAKMAEYIVTELRR